MALRGYDRLCLLQSEASRLAKQKSITYCSAVVATVAVYYLFFSKLFLCALHQTDVAFPD